MQLSWGRFLIPVCIFFWSISLSQDEIKRPLDLQHDWITAHTVISLRVLDNCPWSQTLGVSYLDSLGPEKDCEDLPERADDTKAIYLSYPSFWLNIAYPAFRLASYFWPRQAEYLNLRYVALLLVRLFSLIVVFELYLRVFQWFSKVRGYSAYLAAATGVLLWISAPLALHYTQNVYFSDTVVVPFVLLALLIAYRMHNSLPRPARVVGYSILLGLTSGLDWYGSVAVALILSWHLYELVSGRQRNITFPRLLAYGAGPALAGFLYILQLNHFDPGFQQILHTAQFRTGSEAPGASGKTEFLLGFAKHLLLYLPGFLRPIANSNAFLLLVSSALFLMLALRGRIGRHKIVFILCLTLAPVIQLLILTQHSFVHDFSGLKFSPLLYLYLLVVPLAVLAKAMRSRLPAGLLVSAFCTAIVAGIATQKATLQADYRIHIGQPVPNQEMLNLGPLLQNHISLTQIPVSVSENRWALDRPALVTSSAVPMPLALTGREVYSDDSLRQKRERIRAEAWNKMEIVLIKLTSDSADCKTGWKDTDLEFKGGRALLCKTGLSADEYLKKATAGPPKAP
ncbi:MAG: hypothetical protein KDK23_13045 [Leptospiraceae bacterium]|nr:hypothetical protein [Leptospiraceae bacterium]